VVVAGPPSEKLLSVVDKWPIISPKPLPEDDWTFKATTESADKAVGATEGTILYPTLPEQGFLLDDNSI
jgi:hypothetical protein